MAERNVVREDVVQIGFELDGSAAEVQRQIDALAGGLSAGTDRLTSDVDRASRSMRQGGADLSQGADQAGNGLNRLSDDMRRAGDDLAQGGNRAEGGLDRVSDGARQSVKPLSQMAKEAAALVKTKFDGLAGKLKQLKDAGVDRVTSSVAKLKRGFAGLKNVRLKDVAQGLNKGLGLAVAGAGKLLMVLGKVAAVGLQKLGSGIKAVGAMSIQASGKIIKGLGTASVKAIKGLAAGAAVAGTAITGLMGAAVKVGMSFEAGMSQVAATMGITKDTDDFAKLSAAAKEAGATTKFTATEASDALNYLALAGYDANKACAALPTILDLATAGGMDLAMASDMITDSMSALGISATEEELTKFGDILAKTSQKSNTNIQQLGEAILTIGGTAKGLKGETAELTTALGVLADSGIKSSEGGTHLRNMLISLKSPTTAAQKALKALGVSVYDAQGNMRGVDEIMGDLNRGMEGMTTSQKDSYITTIFNSRDLASVSALMASTVATTDQLRTALTTSGYDVAGLGGSLEDLVSSFDTTVDKEQFLSGAMTDFGMTAEQAGTLYSGLMSVADGSATRWNQLNGYITDSSGAMKNMADTMNDNLQGAITTLGSAAEGLGVEVYESISGPLKETVKEATGWLGELTNAVKTGGIDGLVSSVGDVLAKVVDKIAGAAPKLIAAGMGIIRSLLDGIQKNAASIAAGAANTLTAFVTGITSLLPDLLLLGMDLITQFAQSLIAQLPQVIQAGVSALHSLADGIARRMPQLVITAKQLIQTLVSGLTENMPSIINSGITLIFSLLTGFYEMLPAILQGGVQLIVSLVKGIADNLPAIVEMAGRLVVTWATGLMQAIPDLLRAIPVMVGALIDAILNTDWLKVGCDIVGGIGNGLIDGVKSLFGGGRNAGAEATDGVTAGLKDNRQMVVTAANTVSDAATWGMSPDLDALYGQGERSVTQMQAGMLSNAPGLYRTAERIEDGVSSRLEQLTQGEPLVLPGIEMEPVAAPYAVRPTVETERSRGPVRDTRGGFSGTFGRAAREEVRGALADAGRELETGAQALTRQAEQAVAGLHNTMDRVRLLPNGRGAAQDLGEELARGGAAVEGAAEQVCDRVRAPFAQLDLSAPARDAAGGFGGAFGREAGAAVQGALTSIDQELQASALTMVRRARQTAADVHSAFGETDFTPNSRNAVQSFGGQAASAFAGGLEAGAPQVRTAAAQLTGEVSGAFAPLERTAGDIGGTAGRAAGTAARSAFEGVGREFETGAQTLSRQADQAVAEVSYPFQQVDFAPSGRSAVQSFGRGMATAGAETQAAALRTVRRAAASAQTAMTRSFGTGTNRAGDLGGQAAASFAGELAAGTPQVRTAAQQLTGEVCVVFEALDLTASGKRAMEGFLRGMERMRSRVLASARSIAQGVQRAVNGALDIHSPSRVMQDSGQNTGLGLVRGMDQVSARVERAAQQLAGAVSAPFARTGDAGAPDARPIPVPPPQAAVSGGQTVENNTYAPVFNLTIQGGTGDRDSERKVKQWIREAWAEVQEGLRRQAPKLQEV